MGSFLLHEHWPALHHSALPWHASVHCCYFFTQRLRVHCYDQWYGTCSTYGCIVMIDGTVHVAPTGALLWSMVQYISILINGHEISGRTAVVEQSSPTVAETAAQVTHIAPAWSLGIQGWACLLSLPSPFLHRRLCSSCCTHIKGWACCFGVLLPLSLYNAS